MDLKQDIEIIDGYVEVGTEDSCITDSWKRIKSAIGQAGAGVDALKGLPRYSCGDGHDPCGHGSGLFQTVCGDVFKVADVLAALSQNKEA